MLFGGIAVVFVSKRKKSDEDEEFISTFINRYEALYQQEFSEILMKNLEEKKRLLGTESYFTILADEEGIKIPDGATRKKY